MDLVYADSNLGDLGVIQGYTMDMAYGIDENNFVVSVELNRPQVEAGFFIYIDQTEYGGIVDSIGADTSGQIMTYSGRTWHGIMNGKIIEPDPGYDYYVADGDANFVIVDLIDRLGLKKIFTGIEEESGIDVTGYEFRYIGLYDGLRTMLQDFNAKLLLVWNDEARKMQLSAALAAEYASYNEFDNTQVSFDLVQNFNKINHLICLGQGELKDRYVIHLFMDENAGLQDYLVDMSKPPLQDQDYILDKSMQVLSGASEYAEIYDYPSADITTNYMLLETKPADWESNYFSYFAKQDEDSYEQIEQNTGDKYSVLSSVPNDWNTRFSNYYTRTGNASSGYEYENVEGIETYVYTPVTSRPSGWTDMKKQSYKNYMYRSGNNYVNYDTRIAYKKYTKTQAPSNWKKTYENYYTFDGTNYNQISSVTKYKYVKQTKKPSDWSNHWFDRYYTLFVYKDGKKKVSDYRLIGEVPGMLYKMQTLGKVPEWKKGVWYTRESYSKAPSYKKILEDYPNGIYLQYETYPEFQSNNTYYQETTVVAPAFQTNRYYVKYADVDLGLSFQNGIYYKEVYDHYYELVQSGIERLQELNNMDDLNIDLDENDEEYDIGDIIGARENTTNLYVAKNIVKKIIKIEKDVVTISHEIG